MKDNGEHQTIESGCAMLHPSSGPFSQLYQFLQELKSPV
jgi:hypothetical protein